MDTITLASLRAKVSNGEQLDPAESFWLIDAVADLSAQLAKAP